MQKPFETAEQTAARWGCSATWVRRLCLAGHVDGASKHAWEWLIPAGAAKPATGIRGQHKKYRK